MSSRPRSARERGTARTRARFGGRELWMWQYLLVLSAVVFGAFVAARAIQPWLAAGAMSQSQRIEHEELLVRMTAECTQRQQILVARARANWKRHPRDWEALFLLTGRLSRLRDLRRTVADPVGIAVDGVHSSAGLPELLALANRSLQSARTPEQRKYATYMLRHIRTVPL